MIHTSLALVPGTFVMALTLGVGVLVNAILAMAFCAALEAMCLKIRGEKLLVLKDGSALLTGALIGLCLPPAVPVSIVLVGCLFAIVFAKHFYGGLGQNIFNPAMIGFAVIIVAYPLAMSAWPEGLSMSDLFRSKLGQPVVDAYSGATPLDVFRYRDGLTTEEFWLLPQVNHTPWLWSNLAFAAGGLYLIWKGIIQWIVPACMLATLTLLSIVFYDNGSSLSLGSPYLHLLSGATMIAAFFIVTDPVTSPDAIIGQYLFGIGVGVLTFIIRSYGAYPEGIAFAVLLMNALSPLVDHLTYRRKKQETVS